MESCMHMMCISWIIIMITPIIKFSDQEKMKLQLDNRPGGTLALSACQPTFNPSMVKKRRRGGT